GQSNERIHDDTGQWAQGQQQYGNQGRTDGGGKAGQLAATEAHHLVGGDLAALVVQTLGQPVGHHQPEQTRYDAGRHDGGERQVEGVGRGDGVRVEGHDVACLAAAYHGQQNGRLGEVGTARYGQRYGGNRDDGHVNEDADRSQDQ